ncbi:Crp/Fnr family transcriptional regulator [Phyllobacterium sp. OV277]|uniref:Crp/Fnr family transcriptional regulator n=1 Tax=Phyllobacterium sp. OV277 TaxID=1882772 RepID=UPI0008859D65|nr:Crp/Fnr family transcriptional regulator [Phyllobacterium sp. OV277]SDP69866.1 cAMP-binding domain of CRP or a regulatory subunit of cAMP-dependent protein kinases [Phyllobacterium sp. OV277]
MDPHSPSLATITLLKGLDQQALRRLESQCIWRRYRANEVIIDDQDDSNHLFLVVRGQLRASVSIAGQETIMRDIKAGQYFGEIAAIDNRPRSAHIRCLTDSVVAHMPAPIFWRVIQEYPDVGRQLLISLVSLVRALTDRVNETSALNMKHRLMAELLRLSRPSATSKGSYIISPPPTHAELAARIGSHREAVTRELNQLSRLGLISRYRGAISLQDRDRLQQTLDKAMGG